MAGPSRSTLQAGLGVAVAIGLLLAAGRLWQAGLGQTAPSPGAAAGDGELAPPRPVSGGVEFGQPISGLAVTPTAVWVAYGTTIARLDLNTLEATAQLQVPDAPPGIARPIRGLAAGAGGHAIWASLPGPAGLLRIDPGSARVVAAVPVASVAPPAVRPDGVWVVCCGGETYLGASELVRVDPASNRVAARVPLPGLPDAVGAGAGGVWVRSAAGPVWRVDPASNRVVATVAVPHGLGGVQGSVLVGRHAVWVSDPATSTVVRIDPRSNRVAARVEVAGPALAAAADGAVLATSGRQVLRIDGGPPRGVDADELDGAHVTALAAGSGTIWVAESGMLLHVPERLLR